MNVELKIIDWDGYLRLGEGSEHLKMLIICGNLRQQRNWTYRRWYEVGVVWRCLMML